MALDWYAAALAREAGHDHRSLADHQGASTPNFALLGHDPLVTRDARDRLVGSWGCGETGETAEGRRLALLTGFARDATIIADVTDATAPKKVGEILIRGVDAYDAGLTPDGRFAVIGLDNPARQPTLAGLGLGAPAKLQASFVDACGRVETIPIPEIAASTGVMLFDLADPATPRFADWHPTTAFNLHSISTARIDERTFIVASTVNLVHAASWFHFLEVTETPAGAKLVPLSVFAPPPIARAQGRTFVPSYNGHNDATIATHPGDGRTLAYLAAWDGGMVTLDMTIPHAPVMIAQWVPPTVGLVSSGLTDAGCYPWAIHTTYPFPELWQGRHYVIAGQECPFQSRREPAGQLFIVDDTDPTLPFLVGRWNLPEDTAPWTAQYQASPHYVALVGKTLFVSMYHAGLFAIDLSGSLVAPPSIGVFMPDRPSGVQNPAFLSPVTEQVNALANGDLVLYEGSSGVYVLRFDATNPAPPALPRFR